MNREDLINALEEIERHYTLITLRDSYNNDNILGAVLLNNKHNIQDFQNAIYKAKDKHSDEIYEYGNDWEYISQDLEDFDYIEVGCYESKNYVEY